MTRKLNKKNLKKRKSRETNTRSQVENAKPRNLLKSNQTAGKRSQRLINKKLGIVLPKIDPDKPYIVDHTQIINNKIEEKKVERKPGLNKNTTFILDSNSDVLEKRTVYYNQNQVNEIIEKHMETKRDEKDEYDNLVENTIDLGMDFSFKSNLIAVLNFYGIPLNHKKAALKEKEYEVHIWSHGLPEVDEFKNVLQKSCQLWVISSDLEFITEEYLAITKLFFEQGRGLYLWGNGEPFHTESNKIAKRLFNGSMSGESPGGKIINKQKEEKTFGLVKNHVITTGIDYLYEGINVATIADNPNLQPILYGSSNNLVIAVYEKNGRRAILDGGFTRLYCNWDDAGVGRYVKNAADFLNNNFEYQ